MRVRYYSPALRRFINADIIPGEISNAVTLNRYAYANGNPVSNIDPFGLSAEDKTKSTSQSAIILEVNCSDDDSFGLSAEKDAIVYNQEYYDSAAYKKIKKNAELITFYSDYYGVYPQTVATCIFVEQYYNYDWIDVCTDWFAFYDIIDISVGLGQVKLSTAEYLEKNGYVPKTSAKEGGWYIPFVGFVHGTETMAREKRLENNEWNIRYVAAYIKASEDYWVESYPEISSDPGVLGTLYNQGHAFTIPHPNPQPGPFGEKTAYFYELMEEALR